MEGLYCSKFYIMLACAAFLLTREASAAQHMVGGTQGWDESTDFSSWVSGQTFKVGDQLVFKYSGMHSVVELANESAYKNCDIGSSVDSMNGGNSVVKLNKAGTRYFACGTMGHCDQGMKVKITTVSADSSPSTTSTTSTPSSSSSTTTSASAPSTCRPFGSSSLMAMAVFLVFSMLFIIS
ncbi:hypothetical protein LguiA_016958 [Lonicera macranthoides]